MYLCISTRYAWAGWLAGAVKEPKRGGRGGRNCTDQASTHSQSAYACAYSGALARRRQPVRGYDMHTVNGVIAMRTHTRQSRTRWRDSGRAKTGKSQRARGEWEHDGHTIRNQSTGARILALFDEEKKKATDRPHPCPPSPEMLAFPQAIPVAVKNTGF
jgi:hypothetical protein